VSQQTLVDMKLHKINSDNIILHFKYNNRFYFMLIIFYIHIKALMYHYHLYILFLSFTLIYVISLWLAYIQINTNKLNIWF